MGLVTLTCNAVSAKNVNSNTGTSAFTFLKINTGARAVAMGSAFTGVADDENALYYNPAGIASLERNGLILGYHNYFAGLQSGVVGGIWRRGERRYLAASLQYLNYGSFVQTNNVGEITGDFGGGDILLAFTIAQRQNDRLFYGVTGKLIYEKIQDFSATGVAFDIGIKYRSDRGRLTAGAVVQHLGAQLSNFTDTDKDPLPLTFRAGAGYRPRGLHVQLAGDVVATTDNDPYLAIGGEYYELKSLLFRIGWNGFGSNYRATNSNDGAAGLALGVGIVWKDKQISYSFTPGADLGDSHRITVTGGL